MRHDRSDPELHEFRLHVLSAVEAQVKVWDMLLTDGEKWSEVQKRIEPLRARLTALEESGEPED
jgi:hypothetical protein